MSKFPRWLERVEELVEDLFGRSLDELPALPYRKWFLERLPPEGAVEKVIRSLHYL